MKDAADLQYEDWSVTEQKPNFHRCLSIDEMVGYGAIMLSNKN